MSIRTPLISTSTTRWTSIAYLMMPLLVAYVVFLSPAAVYSVSVFDLPLLLLVAVHLVWGGLLLAGSVLRHRSVRAVRSFFFVPQLLLALSLLYFLFSYVFALNANMDYVQRFMDAGGNLELAIDTRAERLVVMVRLAPLLVLDLLVYIISRVRYPRIATRAGRHRPTRHLASDRIVVPWALIWVVVAAFLRSVAQPSFVSIAGIPVLAPIAYVPLLIVWRRVRLSHGVFLGVVFGALSTLVANYWLGTFNLVSLQIAVLLFALYYAILSVLAILAYRTVEAHRWGRVLVFALAFTVFEYLHSIGFLGYPWSLAGHSLYGFTSLIQIAAITGVWGVSFMVYFANGFVTELLDAAPMRFRGSWRARWSLLVAAGYVVVGFAGAVTVAGGELSRAEARTMPVALIQQSTDPRKNDYDETLQTLMRLTDEALRERPELIVWSETAFVPNIRRWSVDDSNRRFHRLVNEFLEYQRQTRRWLITGNDDYELIRNEAGEIVDRLEYNATVLFSAAGERIETYRKVRLVPFTEYFPYQDTFAGLYELLQEFDVSFWEPGTERTVFEHPDVRFATPICYEDVFPNHTRSFVNAGAQVIINVSNDYWSLSPVQAKQHFVAGLFRTVENHRPLLRATASGLTGYVSDYGRIMETLPYFEPAQMVVDLEYFDEPPTTIYGRWGDWFPIAMAVVLLSMVVTGSLTMRRRCDARHEEAARADR